jgi:O-glycosyl hydrolase
LRKENKEHYDKKEHILKEDYFMFAVKKLLGENKSVNLLNTKNIAREVADNTYNKLGQAKYLKIILMNTEKNELIKIQNSRGSNVGTLLDRYDLTKITNN